MLIAGGMYHTMHDLVWLLVLRFSHLLIKNCISNVLYEPGEILIYLLSCGGILLGIVHYGILNRYTVIIKFG